MHGFQSSLDACGAMAADPAAALRAPADELAVPEAVPEAAPVAPVLLATGAGIADEVATPDVHADRPAVTASAAIAVNVDFSMSSILPHVGGYGGRHPGADERLPSVSSRELKPNRIPQAGGLRGSYR